MADLPQVEQALAQRIAAIVYPEGTDAPSAAGAAVKVYRGWPDPDALTRDLKAGLCHVTIYPRGGVSNVMPDALTRWEDDPKVAPTMTASVAPDQPSISFAGTGAALMLATVVEDDREAWTVAVGPSDTAESVAAALASLIAVDRAAQVSGATLTLPGATRLGAGLARSGTQRRRIRTQRQGMQVSMWCPSPSLRDTLGQLLDLALAEHVRLPVSDGTTALIHYNGTMSDDGTRAQPLYRRDLLLSIDYDTVLVRQGVSPVIVVPVAIAPPAAATPPAGQDEPVNPVPPDPALVKTVLVNVTT